VHAFLIDLYYDATGKAPSKTAVAQALRTLVARVRKERKFATLGIRVARPGPDRLLVDCANGRAVEITPAGCAIVPLPHATFRRAAIQDALVEPDLAAPPQALLWLLDELRLTPPDRLLLACWLVAALVPDIPHPLVAFQGPKGSSKSTSARLLRMLLDPTRDGLNSAPRSDRDFTVNTVNRWLLTYDNVSTVPAWWSDLLCQTSTGGTKAMRQLYTTSGEALFDLRRVVVLTSIPPIGDAEDLLDRLYPVPLKAIPDEQRLPEREWVSRVRPLLPAALGGLYNAAAAVLAGLPDRDRRPARLPRLADWAEIAALAAQAFGTTQEELWAAWSEVDRRRVSMAADVSSLPAVLELLLQACPQARWVGLASELLQSLTEVAAMRQPAALRHPQWPRAAHVLTRRLTQHEAALTARGIAFSLRGTNRGTEVTLTREARGHDRPR
jgi:hypothetical protein